MSGRQQNEVAGAKLHVTALPISIGSSVTVGGLDVAADSSVDGSAGGYQLLHSLNRLVSYSGEGSVDGKLRLA